MLDTPSTESKAAPSAGVKSQSRSTDWPRSVLLKQVIRRRGAGFSVLFSRFFDALCEHRAEQPTLLGGADWQRVKAALRFAARIAKRCPHQRTTKAILKALQTTNPEQALRSVLQQANDERARRQGAAVQVGPLLPELRRFVQLLNRRHRFRIPPLVLAKPTAEAEQLGEHIVAFTDSKRLVLPSIIATTTTRALNQHYAFYLVMHEWGHNLFGSFDFCAKTRRGRIVAAAFEKVCTQDATEIRRKLEESLEFFSYDTLRVRPDSIDRKSINKYIINGTAALFEQTQWPNLTAYLFNVIEDGRIEVFLRHLYPGLSRIRDVHEQHSQGLYQAPEASGRLQNLLQAIAAHAADRCFPAIVHDHHKAVFANSVNILDQFVRLGRRRDVYHSLLTLARLLDVLGPTLNESESETRDAEQRLKLPTSMIEVDLARLHKHLADESTDHTHSGLPFDDQERSVGNEGYLVDELVDDGGYLVLEPQVVQVIFKPHEQLAPAKLPILAPLTLPFPTMKQATQRYGNRSFHADGRYMARDRLAAYLASTRAGIDDYPLMYNRHEGKSRMRVTIVCDLSLSMEAKLSRLSGESPLQRAIQLIKWLSENLRQQGIDFQIVGAHDAGRRPVYVRPLPLQTNDSIESLRSAGYGGFRLGAVLRGLHQHQSGLPSQRHFILAVTDAFGLYLSPGGDGTVSQIQDLCPSCRARSYCNLEREAAKRSAVEALHDGLYFVPDEQVWSDVADALESTNTIGFHLFAMDQDLASRKDVLDAHLATQWSDATTTEGILQGIMRLAEFASK